MCLRTLAVILDRRGDQDGAASVLTELLHIEEDIFGPNNPSTSGTLASLGRVARQKGDLATAESYLRRTLAARSQVLGDRHLALAWINGQLALTLRDQRKFDEYLDNFFDRTNTRIFCYNYELKCVVNLAILKYIS